MTVLPISPRGASRISRHLSHAPLQVVAYGFLLNPHAYLKDAWCQLDFVVVALYASRGLEPHSRGAVRAPTPGAQATTRPPTARSAWLPIIFPSFGNFSVVRSVRALRPLRALKRVPGMPQLVGSILSALPKLGNVGGEKPVASHPGHDRAIARLHSVATLTGPRAESWR